MSLINRFSSILTVAIAVFAFSTFTLAQEDKAATPAPEKDKAEKYSKGHKGYGMGKHGWKRGIRHHGMMRMMHKLDLTESQRTQIRAIREANKPDQAAREEMRSLFEAKRSGTITAEQQARLTAIKEQKKANAKNVREQILNVLTAEQKAQLEQKKAEMKQRREELRQKRELLRQQKTPAVTTETTKEN